ncbi:unnamed protein product [Clavelina lepadiformis]|uniref:Vezatin n=1 Tax=Clavelina lepadiformis TaxID=159417 RepID=A0ABP0GED9_CLALP
MMESASTENSVSDNEEDITLEGSPLHAYLSDLDVVNVNEVKGSLSRIKTTYYEDYYRYLNGFWFGTSLKAYINWQWRSFRMQWANMFPVSQDVLVKMSRYFYTEYGKEILESKIMLEDDLDYLCLQTPQQFLISKRSLLNKDPDGKSTRYSTLIVALLAFFLAALFDPIVPTFIQILFALITCFLTFFNIRLEIIVLVWKRRHEANLEALRKFLKASEKLNSMIRRSIRLVQEMEVVSRGYKLVNGKIPITRLELGTMQNCRAFMKLRLAVLRSAVKCTIVCREATLMLQKYKLDENDIDGLDMYHICNIPLEELGPCFTMDVSSAELLTISDGCCLAVLKSLNDLLRKQRSEMLTRLSLTLSGTTWDFTPNGFLSAFPHLLLEPYKVTMDCLTTLQHSFDMHKNLSNLRNTNDKVSKQNSNGFQSSALFVNMHSLQVHMRAAMLVSIELEEKVLPHKLDISGTEQFHDLKRHFDASLECWDDCLKQIKTVGSEKPSVALKDKHVLLQDTASKPTMINPDEDILVEDQVFEGTADRKDDSKMLDFGTDEPFEKNLEKSSTVIEELQSVLAVKTSEKQREMWKRQLFPHYRLKQSYREDGSKAVKDVLSLTEDNQKISFHKTDNRSQNFSSSNASKKKYRTLSFPKKASLPGRPPSLKKYKQKPGSLTYQPDQTNNVHSTVQSECLSNAEISLGSSTPQADSMDQVEREPKNMDWTNGLGLGFSNDMAMQAVLLAKQRTVGGKGNCETATTFGDDSD